MGGPVRSINHQPSTINLFLDRPHLRHPGHAEERRGEVAVLADEHASRTEQGAHLADRVRGLRDMHQDKAAEDEIEGLARQAGVARSRHAEVGPGQSLAGESSTRLLYLVGTDV